MARYRQTFEDRLVTRVAAEVVRVLSQHGIIGQKEAECQENQESQAHTNTEKDIDSLLSDPVVANMLYLLTHEKQPTSTNEKVKKRSKRKAA